MHERARRRPAGCADRDPASACRCARQAGGCSRTASVTCASRAARAAVSAGAAAGDAAHRRALPVLASTSCATNIRARSCRRAKRHGQLPAPPHRGGRGANAGRMACRRRCARRSSSELALIAELDYEPFFLTVYDIVELRARAQSILCQGRGSAANSIVCYCLGVTAVGPDAARRCCSSASSRASATSRRTSTSISSTSGARRSSSTSTASTAASARRSRPRSSRTGRAARCAIWRARSTFDAAAAGRLARHHAVVGWQTGIDPERIRAAGFDPEAEPRARACCSWRSELVGFPAASVAARRRLRDLRGTARRSWCRSRTPRCRSAPSSSGTRTISTTWAC